MLREDLICSTTWGSTLMLSSIDLFTQDSSSWVASVFIFWSLAASNLSWQWPIQPFLEQGAKINKGSWMLTCAEKYMDNLEPKITKSQSKTSSKDPNAALIWVRIIPYSWCYLQMAISFFRLKLTKHGVTLCLPRTPDTWETIFNNLWPQLVVLI